MGWRRAWAESGFRGCQRFWATVVMGRVETVMVRRSPSLAIQPHNPEAGTILFRAGRQGDPTVLTLTGHVQQPPDVPGTLAAGVAWRWEATDW